MLTTLVIAGNFDSRDWVRLVMCVKRNTPETIEAVQ
jgi:hypothetical protein